MSVPRGSNQSKQQQKEAAFKIILDYANRPSVESFTIADIKPYLETPNMAAAHLRELSDANKLTVMQKPQGELHYARKPTDMLRKAWRIRTNGQIGLVKSDRLGAA